MLKGPIFFNRLTGPPPGVPEILRTVMPLTAARSSVMTLSNPPIGRSYSRAIADKSEFALAVATAFLITAAAAAALILIHATAWAGVVPEEFGLLPLFY
jgi:hypothetical protein